MAFDARGIVDEGLKAPKKQSDADAGVQSTDADASEVGGIVDEVPEAPKKQSGGLIASQSDIRRSPTTSACLIASQSDNLRSPDASLLILNCKK
jgi:hypothetical protein